ncbi:hypothetical protein [Micromonospora sp. CB01531]|uniref:hypothetical protein n=1 Tax=Micromonospora sp. CB01531 TaxID=1718947 RepID=UPI00093C7F9C|nr:hypothetical protein [Micromonospora sp. CB01531]OKI52850.1 hypothetical protein A6A27_08135 [Micromonospora sp. CB01531]
MPGDPLWVNASGGAPAYSANELRQAMALALMYDGRALGGRPGVRPGGNQLRTELAGSTITVRSGVCCIDPGLSTPQGPYWLALPADETHALAAADATNPRKDITIIRVYDHDEDSSGLRLGRSEYLVGQASPTPAAPDVPAGAILSGTIDVPRQGGGAAVVTDGRRFTVAPGGILPVAAAGHVGAAVAGRYRDRLDLNVLERDTGTAWQTIADPTVFTAWTNFTPTWNNTGVAQPVLGNGALVGKYKKIGRIAHVVIKLFWGGTTSAGDPAGYWGFGGFPAALNGTVTDIILSGACWDSSAVGLYDARAQLSNAADQFGIVRTFTTTPATGAARISSTVPFTWAAQDYLYLSGTIETQS